MRANRGSWFRPGVFLVLAGSLLLLAGVAAAEPPSFGAGPVRVYGAEGPEPALRQAASEFSARFGASVVVQTGPPDEWIARAVSDGHVVFASAEFMMSRFLRDPALGIVPESVRPLYLRTSAVLVRPGNPRGIRDFPDLLRPGTRILVVCGSGQTGLWEDMSGRSGDLRTVRLFARNVAVRAETSTEAIRIWSAQPDLDAYVTWNIWHRPLRDAAQLVTVSEPWRIHRQCSVALTRRGEADAAAQSFVEFLASDAGAAIFASWDWIVDGQGARAGHSSGPAPTTGD